MHADPDIDRVPVVNISGVDIPGVDIPGVEDEADDAFDDGATGSRSA